MKFVSSPCLATLLLAGLFSALAAARAADAVTMKVDDGAGQNSFSAAGNWSDGQTPSSGKTYYAEKNIRTPANRADISFAGDRLTLATRNARLALRGEGLLSVADLTLKDGAALQHWGADSTTVRLGGSLLLEGYGRAEPGSRRTLRIESAIHGDGALHIGNGAVIVSARKPNTYSGGTRIGASGAGKRGLLSVETAGALGSGDVELTSAATLTLGDGTPGTPDFLPDSAALILPPRASDCAVVLAFSGVETIGSLRMGPGMIDAGLYTAAELNRLLVTLGATADIFSGEGRLRVSAGSERQGPAALRAKSLGRGVNLSHWYSQSMTGRYDEKHLSTHFTADDIALIVSMGFDHVRLSLDNQVLFDPANPGRLKAEPLAKFDERLSALLDAGLKVIVDLHPGDDFKAALHQPANEAAFIADWSALAAHLSARDPERVLFELLNEPAETWDTETWAPVQGRVLAAVRKAAPLHTLIVAPGKWTGVDDLLKLQPYADDNLIYTFHWYDPYLFTHQSAEWGWAVARRVAGLEWPIEPADAEAAVQKAVQNSENVVRTLKWQLEQGWHRSEWITAKLDELSAWQRKHGWVPIYVGELGVYAKKAPPESRYRWHEESRKLIEERGWSWAVWDYRHGFRVTAQEKGKTVADERMLKALGLRP